MISPFDNVEPETSGISGPGLPPGRLEELQPRLQALLADFARLEELETLDLEPIPAFSIEQAQGDRHE